MSYLERERARLVGLRDGLFKDPGGGAFIRKPRDFVLNDRASNLWAGIREDALEYFRTNNISWWQGDTDQPTGHLLSSQIACVNHLYYMRQRPDLATAVLHAIDSTVIEAVTVDTGLIEFEFIGEKSYLHERSFVRGAHCTSVDAFMIGRTVDGARRAFLIEWKYTEMYRQEDKYIPERKRVYDQLIADEHSPFKPIDPPVLYFEPFYQLMRQTLLGWLISKNQDHRCTSYCHVHVIPEQNTDLLQHVTSPGLEGRNISEAWANVLRRPSLYVSTTPAMFMQPVSAAPDTKALTHYLQVRYWVGE